MTADNQPLPTPAKCRRLSMCVGCGSRIQDQFLLRVAPDLEWHASCLKCAECGQYLDETCTCFVRDGKTYCKRDYTKLYGHRCAKCDLGFMKNDFVMRAKDNAYHIDCFRCVACRRQLIPGDKFALKDDGLLCKEDHGSLVGRACSVKDESSDCESSLSGRSNTNTNNDNNHNNSSNNNNIEKTKNIINNNIKSENGLSCERRDHCRKNGLKKEHKPTRVRTVLNEKQLHTLRTCYNANPRPDALMKEQLVEMTNLSARVIRVWFQNKRCKDKKRSIFMKQMQQQQEKNGGRLHGHMQGVPMVASSPVRHESSMQANAVEVQAYQPPWKALSDFAIQSEMDHHPPFQQLMISFDHVDSDVFDSRVGHIDVYPNDQQDDCYQRWQSHDEYDYPPGSVNSDYGETPSDVSSPMSQ